MVDRLLKRDNFHGRSRTGWATPAWARTDYFKELNSIHPDASAKPQVVTDLDPPASGRLSCRATSNAFRFRTTSRAWHPARRFGSGSDWVVVAQSENWHAT